MVEYDLKEIFIMLKNGMDKDEIKYGKGNIKEYAFIGKLLYEREFKDEKKSRKDKGKEY